jgi:hypothetical protein
MPRRYRSLLADKEKKIMEQRDYEIAKELKEKLSEIVHLIDFRVFG